MRLAAEQVSLGNLRITQIKADKRNLYKQIESLAGVSEAETLVSKLERLEGEIYKIQARLLEARETVLREQDRYWRLKMKEIRNRIEPPTEEEIDEEGDRFFDAVESEAELERMLGRCGVDPRLTGLKDSLLAAHKQLAGIRNQKKRLQEQRKKGVFLQRFAEQEGSAELKEALSKRESKMENERCVQVKKERSDTLQRIRDYRVKNPLIVPKKKLPPNRSPPKLQGAPLKSDKQMGTSPEQKTSPTPISSPSSRLSDTSTCEKNVSNVNTAEREENKTPASIIPTPPPLPPNSVPPPPPPPPPSLLGAVPRPPAPMAPLLNPVIAENADNCGKRAEKSSMNSVLDAIRKGVELRKTEIGGEEAGNLSKSGLFPAGGKNCNPLMKALEERLKSVRKAIDGDESSQGEESEGEGFDD